MSQRKNKNQLGESGASKRAEGNLGERGEEKRLRSYLANAFEVSNASAPENVDWSMSNRTLTRITISPVSYRFPREVQIPNRF